MAVDNKYSAFDFEVVTGNKYEAYFTASGNETFVYLNREKKGNVIISSAPVSGVTADEPMAFSDDYVERNAPANVAIKMKYPSGVIVRVTSYGAVSEGQVIGGESVVYYPAQNNGGGGAM